MTLFITIVRILLACLLTVPALLSFVLFIRFRWPAATMWGLKIFVSTLSTIFFFTGIISVLFGIMTRDPYLMAAGAYVTGIYFFHFMIITRPPSAKSGFAKAFGPDWEKRIQEYQRKHFLHSRRVLGLPGVPKPRIDEDLPFATVPGTGQVLLCDLWRPADTIKPSGLAYVYMHGGAFYMLDKNFATRPFFRHLAAQGHVIMDVAYRMAPEVGLADMIKDVKRALVWMKENAERFGVDPGRIILGGGSSGGYLALMAAYTGNAIFSPEEHQGKDLHCLGVVAESPPTDLEALYRHTNRHRTGHPEYKDINTNGPRRIPAWLKRLFARDFHRLHLERGLHNIGAIAPLLGGSPEECPESYKVFSPGTYLHSDCPPTLLIHGNHDIMAPVQATRFLFDRLTAAKIPAVMHILPQADHSFNRFLPNISPAAINVLYDIERFIALTAGRASK